MSPEKIPYQLEGSDVKLEVIYEQETVWLTQAQMSQLFEVDRSVIGKHIKRLIKDEEVDEKSNVQKMHIAFSDKPVTYYSLDIIILVGFSVNSKRGSQFRKWAMSILKEYATKGYVLDDKRLSEGRTDYFEELEKRIRAIRTSEINVYRKVRDIFATSVDYNKESQIASDFYAAVQNKFHYAITGRTAAEIITDRADEDKPNLGLKTWRGQAITPEDAVIAKNYLEEIELQRLELLVEQFLAFAELRAVERKPMQMQDWVDRLDSFIRFNEKPVLTHKGKVSHDDMLRLVRDKFNAYNQRMEDEAVFEDALRTIYTEWLYQESIELVQSAASPSPDEEQPDYYPFVHKAMYPADIPKYAITPYVTMDEYFDFDDWDSLPF